MRSRVALCCPGCGAPQPDELGSCEHCHSPRIPLGLPPPERARPCLSCGRSNDASFRFCVECGAEIGDTVAVQGQLPCPSCGDLGGPMHIWGLGRGSNQHVMSSCARCGGVWLDAESYRGMLDRAREVGDVPELLRRGGAKRTLQRDPRGALLCPACDTRMARGNFASRSGVLVDYCRDHGAWFDAGELRAVLAYAESGGLGDTYRDPLVAPARPRPKTIDLEAWEAKKAVVGIHGDSHWSQQMWRLLNEQER